MFAPIVVHASPWVMRIEMDVDPAVGNSNDMLGYAGQQRGLRR